MTDHKKPTKKQQLKLRRIVEATAGKPIESWAVVRGFPRKQTVH